MMKKLMSRKTVNVSGGGGGVYKHVEGETVWRLSTTVDDEITRINLHQAQGHKSVTAF